ncbi:hypothetical protein HPB48_026533 [Haemaphysalis longicornis]|uniref:THAP-type domain-containing protein n=1 Tax=Haemaphysalis longicornis TaxID=44386 RepID=A0A9J6HCJ6_HAELO|nr:hypothetical protein HPB48_026533 [Haemaphysalis longicornis]
MVYCCVQFCKSSGRTAASRGISFHEFPITDVRNLWLKNIRQADGPGKQPWLPNDRSKVCSLHFRPEDYRESTKYRRLKPDATPTLFPDLPTYLQPAPSQPRRPAKCKRVVEDLLAPGAVAAAHMSAYSEQGALGRAVAAVVAGASYGILC